MGFICAREAADRWGISQRRVAVLCSENRIANATMVGNMWIIPDDAEKPIDARSTRYNESDEKGVKPFWTAPFCADSTKKATTVAIIKI